MFETVLRLVKNKVTRFNLRKPLLTHFFGPTFTKLILNVNLNEDKFETWSCCVKNKVTRSNVLNVCLHEHLDDFES